MGKNQDLAKGIFANGVTGVTKSMVGLGSADNTADTAKPVSTATQTALNLKADTSTVNSQVWNYSQMPTGSVLQVVTASSGFTNQTISSASPVLLSNMSVSITPKFANSKIIITGMVSASWSYVASLHIYKNGVELIGNHAGNNQSGGGTALFTHYQSSQESSRPNQIFSFPVLYADLPNTTSATTYDFRANSGWGGGSEAFYFNNRNSLDMLSSSWIMVQEIKQ